MTGVFNIRGRGAAVVFATAALSGCVDFDEPLDGSGSGGSATEASTSTTGTGVATTDSASETASGTTASATTGGGTAMGTGVDTDATTGGDNGPWPLGPAHGLTGELMLLMNARLSSPDAGYSNHEALAEAGTYVGPSLYLYDPAGVGASRMVRLGRLLLDASMGEVSVGDDSLRRFTVRDIAWHPERGLWGVGYDPKNDEWSLVKLDVPDWSRTDNVIGVDRWAIYPSLSAQDPAGDPCYWYESVSGLAFVGEDLLLGVRGLGGVGLAPNGAVFRVDIDRLESEGHCVYPNDVSQDPLYYACGNVCSRFAEFDEGVGVAGDLEASAAGDRGLAIARVEDPALIDQMALFAVDPPVASGPSAAVDLQVRAAEFFPGNELEGLARVGDALYATTPQGEVWRIDEGAATFARHDAVGELLPDFPEGARFRGAARVVLP
jgi:hypothetical protein